MSGFQIILSILLIVGFLILVAYLNSRPTCPLPAPNKTCPTCPSSQVSDDILSYVQSLLQNTPHRQGLSSELVNQRKDIVDANLNLIHTSNLQERARLERGKTDQVVTFTANRFLPYTHQEIIQLFTGLLIPEEYRNPMYPNPAPPMIRAAANGSPNGATTGGATGGATDGDTGKSYKIDFSKIPSTQARYDIFYGISPKLFGEPLDQGTCGSCWAFASCGVLGAQLTKQSVAEKAITLSVQYYIDCVQQNYGCDGGFPVYVYEKVATDKFVVFDDGAAPYVQQKDKIPICDNPNLTRFKVDLKGIISFGKEDAAFFTKDNLKGAELYRSLELQVPSDQLRDKIKKILFFYGPMTVLIYVDTKLPYVSSGIYKSTDMKDGMKMNPNHAVIIAGFGVDLDGEEYWIIRNSWGKDWAESGYFQLSVDSPICGLTLPILGSTKDLPLIES
jgi:hypothetical protein